MEGKTHAVVGMSTAIIATQPKTSNELLTALVFGAIGGLICDVDASKSDASKAVNFAIGGVIGLCTCTALADMFFDVFLMDRITNNTITMRLVLGILILLSTLCYSKGKPHRTQAHSLLTLPVLCLGLGFIFQDGVFAFSVGFISHIMIDLLNMKKVYFLYPCKLGASFKLCKSNGKTNKYMYYIGLATAAILSFIIWNKERCV